MCANRAVVRIENSLDERRAPLDVHSRCVARKRSSPFLSEQLGCKKMQSPATTHQMERCADSTACVHRRRGSARPRSDGVGQTSPLKPSRPRRRGRNRRDGWSGPARRPRPTSRRAWQRRRARDGCGATRSPAALDAISSTPSASTASLTTASGFAAVADGRSWVATAVLATGEFTGELDITSLQIALLVPSRKPFRAVRSDEGSNPSPSASAQ